MKITASYYSFLDGMINMAKQRYLDKDNFLALISS